MNKDLSHPQTDTGKRCGFIYTKISTKSLYQLVIINVHSLAALAPGINGSIFKRYSLVRHDQIRIELKDSTQTVTTMTCAIGTVETEQPRRQLGKRGLRMIGTREFFTVYNIGPCSGAAIFFIFVRLLHHYNK